MIKLLLLIASLSSPLNYTLDSSKASMIPIEVANVLTAPSVVMVHQFNTDAADQFSKDMQDALKSGEPIIPVVIDSYGGSIYALLRMVDIIQSMPVPVATICVSKCMSAGALLLAMGTKGMRYAAPNSTILIHDINAFAEGKLPDIVNQTAELERLNYQIFGILSKQTGKPADFFLNKLKAMSNVDWYLTPEEAKNLGIVNHIKLPKIKVTVKTEMILE